MGNMSAKFDKETCNGVVSIVFTRSTDGTHGRTHTHTEPQQRYYIPSATRCAGIINIPSGTHDTRLVNLILAYFWLAMDNPTP